MHAHPEFAVALARCPLVAILRGVRPDEIVGIADVLVDVGFTMIEVPFNSPEPLVSIARIAARYPAPVLVGAGTVLTVEQVDAVQQAGGKLIVSPNTDSAVIEATCKARMISLPGYFTPSEAFAALAAGANGLKLFPADGATRELLHSHRAVLPANTPVFVVGGVKPDAMAEWQAGGATGFGLGSALYKPGTSAADVRQNAKGFYRRVGFS